MEVDILAPSNLKSRNDEPIDIDQDDITGEDHQAIVSNLNRCSGSALYTFGDNIVQCSLFGPNPMSSNLNLLKKNYFNVYLYPLGKIKNLTKGLMRYKFWFILLITFSFQINP